MQCSRAVNFMINWILSTALMINWKPMVPKQHPVKGTRLTQTGWRIFHECQVHAAVN